MPEQERVSRMRVGVLGGLGFLGSRLSVRLAEFGYEVRILSRNAACDPMPGIHVLKITSTDPLEWREAFRDLDAVFDLVSGGHWLTTGKQYTNISSLKPSVRNFVEWAAAADIKRYVLVSSGGAVYGEWRGRNWREDDVPQPVSAYGRAKLIAELEAFDVKPAEMKLMVARPGNAYGSQQLPNQGQGLVATAISAALHEVSLEIWGGVDVTRDYVHVDDIADGLAKLISPGLPEGSYNLGTGLETSTLRLLRILTGVLEARGLALRFHSVSSSGVSIRRNALDSSKAKHLLRWFPDMDLERGLASTVDETLGVLHLAKSHVDPVGSESRFHQLRWAPSRRALPAVPSSGK